MARRLQIIISSRPPAGLPGQPTQKPSFWNRFKLLVAGICIAIATAGVLVTALVLGWIVAAVICLLVMIVVIVVILRGIIRRAFS